MSQRPRFQLSALTEKARQRGFITLKDVLLSLPPGASTDQIDKVLQALAEAKVQVVGNRRVTTTTRKKRSPTASFDIREETINIDPVAMYMRQLNQVPLLGKSAEMAVAQQLESARMDLLRAATQSSLASEELQQLRSAGIEEDWLDQPTGVGASSRVGVVKVDIVKEGDVDGDDAENEREVFQTLVDELTILYRRRRDAREPEQRDELAQRIAAHKALMVQHFSQCDFLDTYIKRLMQRIREIVDKLHESMADLAEIEQQSNLTISELKKQFRAHRNQIAHTDSLEPLTTAELQLPDVLINSNDDDNDALSEPLAMLSKEALLQVMQRIKNAERRIRIVERKSDVSSAELRQMYRRMVDAERRTQRAKDALVLANQRLVVHIAARYANRGLPFLELVQEGNIGLMRAVEKFDYRRGYKFSTYGTWWIRHAISRAIANQSRTIRLPVHIRDAIHKVVRESRKHVLEVGREPTAEELAERLHMSVERIDEILDASRKTLRWELPMGEDGEGELGETVADEVTLSPYDEVNERDEWAHLIDALGELRDREREVIERRYGLSGHKAQTLEEVGQELGITRERVRQIQARAMRKLQVAIRVSTQE